MFEKPGMSEIKRLPDNGAASLTPTTTESGADPSDPEAHSWLAS